MIVSFGDKATEDIFEEEKTKQSLKILPIQLHQIARRKLDALDTAQELKQLRVPAGNRLELLKGDKSGFHSIRINNQYRIVFKWKDQNAFDVRICDYH
jgi:proteic killer suppression protein